MNIEILKPDDSFEIYGIVLWFGCQGFEYWIRGFGLWGSRNELSPIQTMPASLFSFTYYCSTCSLFQSQFVSIILPSQFFGNGIHINIVEFTVYFNCRLRVPPNLLCLFLSTIWKDSCNSQWSKLFAIVTAYLQFITGSKMMRLNNWKLEQF